MKKRLSLAHLPTRIQHFAALDELLGVETWVKRDDTNGGPAAGNKIRKLEFLLADAQSRSCTHVITCGDEQSNHARATAILAAQLGMKAVLVLRTKGRSTAQDVTGNALLSRLVGATTIPVDHDEYERRDQRMAEQAESITEAGGRAYVIPEGGSNGLGALGYVEAMREVRQQLELGLLGSIREFDAVVVPCGTGGTAAGAALGARLYGVAERVIAIAVCADSRHFVGATERIMLEARALDPRLCAGVPLRVIDDFRGPGYAVCSAEQLSFIVRVARATGLILDPVYNGKALFGLSKLETRPRRALFIHTGGLPGTFGQAEVLATHASNQA